VLLAGLDRAGALTRTVSVGSTSVRAHRAAAGTRKTPVPRESADAARDRQAAADDLLRRGLGLAILRALGVERPTFIPPGDMTRTCVIFVRSDRSSSRRRGAALTIELRGSMTLAEGIDGSAGVQADAGDCAPRSHTPQVWPEGDQDATAESRACMYCSKASAMMEPAPDAPGRFQCVTPTPYWNTTCSRFLPHCPPWCTEPHLPVRTPLDEVDRWLHYSDGISTVFPDPEKDGLGPVMVEATISAREPVGKELEPVEVHLGDIIMSPPQLMAFASVLKTTALLASLDSGGRARIECRQGCDYLQDPEPRPVLFMR
jgi:hypothetical protein